MEPVAIVGIGCRFPGACSPESFWELIRNGVDAIQEVPESRWNISRLYDPAPQVPGKMNTLWCGLLNGVDEFDHEFFGIPPREAMHMDPQQRLLLTVAWEALEYAGQSPDRLRGSDTGVFVGISSDDYSRLYPDDFTAIEAYSGTGNALSVAANRISYMFDLRGPSWIVDTACSSSLVAIHQACQSLRSAECSLAIAGGVNLILSPQLTIAFSQAGMMSPRGRCRTFDDSADGYVRGEGCGLIVLKRFSDAVRDRDNILAVIRGSAVNQDGRTNGMTSPNGISQKAVIRMALARSGVSAAHLGYVEAHGTGTSLGDPIEMNSLLDVLMEGRSPTDRCWIGSVKTNIGHLEAAAGIAGLIKAVLALMHKEIPPQLHLMKLNRYISLANTPISVAVTSEPWSGARGRRLAGVSSFGFAGTNAHVILQESPSIDTSSASEKQSFPLLTLSAKTKPALRELAGRYAQHISVLGNTSQDLLPDICHTANAGRACFQHRLAIVSENSVDMGRRLQEFAESDSVGHPSTFCHSLRTGTGGVKSVFLFTGQGSQYVGMGRELYESEAVFRRVMERCDAVFAGLRGESLREVLYGEDAEKMQHTGYAQPALFAVEMALAELWRQWGIDPGWVMGHSLGEYAAACFAGIFSLEDGVRLVTERSRLMESMAPGAMAAVFAPWSEVAPVIDRQGGLSIAAFNGPRHVVISGAVANCETAIAELARQGVTSQRLKVTRAFHSSLMEPMLEEFAAIAREIDYAPPKLTLVSNLTGQLVGAEMSTPQYWVEHIRRPVQFEAAMQQLAIEGAEVLLEIGPRPTLLGLARECHATENLPGMASLRTGVPDRKQILSSLAELYTLGADVDWIAFHQHPTRRKLPLPTYPFHGERCWLPSPKRHPLPVAETQDNNVHPLLGRQIDLAAMRDDLLFQSQILEGSPSFLKDHRVRGKAIFPASAYIEMALASLDRQGKGSGLILDDVRFLEPLVLSSAEPSYLQCHLSGSSSESNALSFSIHSREPQQNGHKSQWTAHARGRLQRIDVVPSAVPLNLTELRRDFPEEIDTEYYFEFFRSFGNEYGPSFRALEQAWIRGMRCLGRVRLPESCIAEAVNYTFHPVLLDACFQLACITSSQTQSLTPEPWIPAAVERLEIYSHPGLDLWALAETTTIDPQTAVADVRVIAPNGELLAHISNLLMRKTSAAGLVYDDSTADWLYRVDWRPSEPAVPATVAARQVAGPSEIARHLQELLPAIAENNNLNSYIKGLAYLNDLGVHHITKALLMLGWEPQPEEQFSIEAKAAELAVTPARQRLFQRFIEILAEHGLVARSGSAWRITAKFLPYEMRDETSSRAETTMVQAEAALLERCGPSLADALRGKCDPIELLFPRGDLSLPNQLYESSPGARAMNKLVAEAVSMVLKDLPPSQRVRILEIGVGTGGTTSAIVAALPRERVDYVATDISPWFMSKARERFAENSWMNYGVLDIERDPEKQGFEAGGFDVIVAANVLHATSDLRQSLRNVETLLKPGGHLVLLEGTKPTAWVDMTFGLTDGWWRFSDTDLRPIHPLLETQAWESLLLDQGFNAAASVSPFLKDSSAESAVILAQTPPAKDVSQEAAIWLVFADRGGVGQALAARFRVLGFSCPLVFAAQEFSHAATERYEINPFNEQNFAHLLTSLFEDSSFANLKGVAFLWSLEADERSYEALLHLVKALARLPRAPRLCLVTRGAVPAREAMSENGAVQSPLWGMANVIALEHPELRCLRLDLDPAYAEDATEMLLNEMMASSAEDQAAFRGGDRYVPRLVRHQTAKSGEIRKPLVRPDASYLITGGLNGLGLLTARWMVDRGAGQIILLGRRDPDVNAFRAVRELESLGATIMTVKADVADAIQMAHVMAEIQGAMSPLRGIVHGAGVLDNGILLNMTADRFRNVLRPKVAGAWNLHRLTANCELDFFVMFSSTASILGSSGQANHAAANAGLDALAHYRHAMNLPGLSINWGAWSEIGSAATKDIEAKLETVGIRAISPRSGLDALESLMASSAIEVAVMPVDWVEFSKSRRPSPLLSDLLAAPVKQPASRPSTPKTSFMKEFEKVQPQQKRGLLLEHVRSQVAMVRGVDASEIDLNRGLFDLGLDSLMAIDLRKTLEESLACSLPSTIAFDYPTVEALVDYMARDVLFLETAPVKTPVEGLNQQNSLAVELASLSTNEVAARLSEKMLTLKQGQGLR